MLHGGFAGYGGGDGRWYTIYWISNCHCIQCRKTHGIYGAYSNVKEKDIKFFNKKTLRWFKSSKNA
ncbi:MAG: hypothetical protein QGI09_08205, partial [Dehalococcoidia bacterium]|nr:hypothetical protein [Dehalococcoidia bacterium]